MNFDYGTLFLGGVDVSILDGRDPQLKLLLGGNFSNF